MIRRILIMMAVCVFVTQQASGREMKGVVFDESKVIGGTECPLVGIGLRKQLIISVYLGALYMPGDIQNAEDVIVADQPKQVLLHFLYKEVGNDQLVEAWNEGFEKNGAPTVGLRDQISEFNAMFTKPVHKGDTIAVTYVPERGTVLTINDMEKGTIAGTEFMNAVFSIWFGPHPPSGGLKKGMLGD